MGANSIFRFLIPQRRRNILPNEPGFSVDYDSADAYRWSLFGHYFGETARFFMHRREKRVLQNDLKSTDKDTHNPP